MSALVRALVGALVSPLVSGLRRGVSTSCVLIRRAARGKAYDRK